MEKFDSKKAEELEKQYDSGVVTRPIQDWLAKFVFVDQHQSFRAL